MVAVKYMGTYDYQPSIPAAIVFASLFGATSILHIFQLVRHRTWFFIPFVIGGFCKYTHSVSGGSKRNKC